jgi:hypothetical protein
VTRTLSGTPDSRRGRTFKNLCPGLGKRARAAVKPGTAAPAVPGFHFCASFHVFTA